MVQTIVEQRDQGRINLDVTSLQVEVVTREDFCCLNHSPYKVVFDSLPVDPVLVVSQATEEGVGGDSQSNFPLIFLRPAVEIPTCYPYILGCTVQSRQGLEHTSVVDEMDCRGRV